MSSGPSSISTRKTRLMVLVDTLEAGGAERLAAELACAVAQHQFDVHVVASRSAGPLESLLAASNIPLTVLGRTRRFSIAPWRRALQIARQSDLIHSHKFGSNVWAALLSRLSGTPLIAHEHNFAAAASRTRSLLDRWLIARSAARIVCVSESVAAVERDMGIPAAKLAVIPNGVRTNLAWPRHAAREELGLAETDFIVGIVGRLRPEKAHEVLLEAASLIPQRESLRVCIVGDGPQRTALETRATELGVTDCIRFAGEHEDAARLASAFDVAVICSDWEGLPLAALEAMAAGVPLIASQVGGLPDLLRDGAGLLVPPRSPQALAQAIDQLRGNKDFARTIADLGRARVAERHSFRGMVAEVEELYASVLASRSDFGSMLSRTQDKGKAA